MNYEVQSSEGANQLAMQYDYRADIAAQRLVIASAEGTATMAASVLGLSADACEAVVSIHGALRNADTYAEAAMLSAAAAGVDALVIAPQFLTEFDVRPDAPSAGLLHWEMEGWKGGYPARQVVRPDQPAISSFTALDTVLEHIPDLSPKVHTVRLIGNSAGARLVQAYAAVGRAPDTLARQGIHTRFVVSNPSTYLYFDAVRPQQQSDGAWRFAQNNEPHVNNWRWGLGGYPPAYVQEDGEAAFARYVNRDVVYLLGEDDNNTDAPLLETHPAAMAQGRQRHERGELFFAYIAQKAGRVVHRLVTVPGVGHDQHEMFGSEQGVTAIFGEPAIAA